MCDPLTPSKNPVWTKKSLQIVFNIVQYILTIENGVHSNGEGLHTFHPTGFGKLSNYNSGNLCRGWTVGGLCSSFSKKTVRTIRSKLDQCVAPNLTMCLLYLSVYGCCKLTELNDFLVVFSALC